MSPGKIIPGKIVIVGAGIGGLACAVELAARGLDVVVVEQAPEVGGKLRTVTVGGVQIDAGPTVLTMRWVFEEIFARAGFDLASLVSLKPASILARHHWGPGESLDLFADIERSAQAIENFAGAAEAAGYRAFCDRARTAYQTLDASFMRAQRPDLLGLTQNAGPSGLIGLLRSAPFSTLWREISGHFRDPRLKQLFGRYATYCGSSPFLASATLMLIAHVEQRGVWLVDGGMHQLAAAFVRVAAKQGVTFRLGVRVTDILVRSGRAAGVVLAGGEQLSADAVVHNGDVAALTGGHMGRQAVSAIPEDRTAQRSLSAITWAMVAGTAGFPLVRHNVFFSRAYEREFTDIFEGGRAPSDPTVYLCAQDRDGEDRDGEGSSTANGPERLFCIVNAPANGDSKCWNEGEIEACETRIFATLKRCGLHIAPLPGASLVTTPTQFDRLYTGTGGALYGQATHGWRASFRRPGARSRIGGLYLAGGSVHPGAGLPMAALSGHLAAESLIADLASTRRSARTAMSGGMSTRSAPTGTMR